MCMCANPFMRMHIVYHFLRIPSTVNEMIGILDGFTIRCKSNFIRSSFVWSNCEPSQLVANQISQFLKLTEEKTTKQTNRLIDKLEGNAKNENFPFVRAKFSVCWETCIKKITNTHTFHPYHIR